MRLVGVWLIKLGFLVLSFAAYQLWGTGLFQAQSQLQLATEFNELVANTSSPTAARATPSSVPASTLTPLLDTSDTPVFVQSPVEILQRQSGEVAARLLIPKIGLDEYVVEGVGSDELKQGPGHYPGTPMPGTTGNASVAGHRTTWGAPFGRIDELAPGDKITVEMPWGPAEYEVEGHDDGAGGQRGYFVVDPSEVWVLDQDGENRLTLTSCQPKYSARQRIIVTAKLISTPITAVSQQPATSDTTGSKNDGPGTGQTDNEFPDQSDPADNGQSTQQYTEPQASFFQKAALPDEQDSFGAGLSGDPTARGPALLLTVVAALMWLGIEALARRWRAPVVYAGAALPFVGLWFVAFTFIDRAIPSY